MPRNVSRSPHEVVPYTLRFIFTLRALLKGPGGFWQIVSSQRERQFTLGDLGPRVHSAALSAFRVHSACSGAACCARTLQLRVQDTCTVTMCGHGAGSAQNGTQRNRKAWFAACGGARRGGGVWGRGLSRASATAH